MTPRYSYEEASRWVFETETGDPVCQISDLPEVEEVHRRGRLIMALLNAAEWSAANA